MSSQMHDLARCSASQTFGHEQLFILRQGYTIQGASLDFSINATVASPSAAGNVTTDVVSLGPSMPVGLGAKVGDIMLPCLC